MSRAIHPNVESELTQPTYRYLVLVELLFDGGAVRAHSGAGEFLWNGDTFLGVGQFGAVEAIEETTELKAWSLKLSLSGVEPALVAISLAEDFQGRAANVWLAFLDSDHQLIGDPVGPWSGRMDTMDGQLGAEGVITVTVESRLADWERPRIRRYTHEDQQLDYPGDRGLEFVSQMVEKEVAWGPR